MIKKFKEWWYFHVKNPVVRKGEAGGFTWVFRKFGLEVRTRSGNFRAQWTADEHPYGYLAYSDGNENIHGFAMTVYMVSKLLTTEPRFAEDIQLALKAYEKRLDESLSVVEDPVEEEIALTEMKDVQEQVEKNRRRRKRNGDKG